MHNLAVNSLNCSRTTALEFSVSKQEKHLDLDSLILHNQPIYVFRPISSSGQCIQTPQPLPILWQKFAGRFVTVNILYRPSQGIPLFLLICVFMANSLKMKLAIGILMVMALITAVAAENGRLRIGRFLVEDGGGNGEGESEVSKAQTCSKNPYVCSAKNSGAAGPNCCDNKCVNVLTNSNYCGSCNVKCQFASGCCNGKCANLAYDAQNCGTCGNKCKQGVRCVYGMCNYA